MGRYYMPVHYDRICLLCGKKFEAHDKRKVYCSRRCRDIALRIKKGIPCNPNPEPIHKICVICGKPFDTYREATTTCSSECAKEKHRRNDRHRYTFTRAEYVAKVKAEAEARKEEKKLAKSRINLIRHINAYANKRTPKTCAFCGGVFYSEYPSKKNCSDGCQRKAYNHRRDSKKRISKDKIIDADIELPKLFKRDKGICWICGCSCDWNDKRISKNGHEYPGDTYPTKDHVVPVSRGGTESWDNVRLACWKCNCMGKRDNLYPYVPLDMEFAYSCKAKGNPPKKTAQYTLDGELIKIWESTASIRRELGLNDKHIQNVCRGEKNSTGNAYGFHWEYIREA